MYVYVFNGVTYGQEIFSGYRIYGFSVLCAGFPGGTGTADSGISVGLGCVSCLWLCLEIRYPKTLAHYHHFPIEGRTSLYSEDIIGVNTNRDRRKEWLLMYVLFFFCSHEELLPVSQMGNSASPLRLPHPWLLVTAALPLGGQDPSWTNVDNPNDRCPFLSLFKLNTKR